MSDKVRKSFIRLILSVIPATVTGRVVSVDESDFTCEVKPSTGGSNYQDVRLKSSIDNDDAGVVSIPEIGSEVVISCLQHNDHAYYVSRFSKVKKWHLKTVSGAFIEITQQGIIKINGDAFGGVMKSEISKQKFNALENKINQLVAIFSSWTPVANDGGAALKAAVTTWASSILILTTKPELENTEVKHG